MLRFHKRKLFGDFKVDCVGVGPVQEETHLPNYQLWMSSSEETFSSHASVEVVSNSHPTEVSKQIIFSSVEVSFCYLLPCDSSALFLVFLIFTCTCVSFKPCFPVGSSADLTSGLHVDLCRCALNFSTWVKWPVLAGQG